VKVSGWLGEAPHALAVIYVVLGLVGLASPSILRQVAWPLTTYVVLFAVTGQPFNFYWGWVTAPIWAFSIAHALEGIPRLYQEAWRHPSSNAISRP
jgi:hypothetical protein